MSSSSGSAATNTGLSYTANGARNNGGAFHESEGFVGTWAYVLRAMCLSIFVHTILLQIVSIGVASSEQHAWFMMPFLAAAGFWLVLRNPQRFSMSQQNSMRNIYGKRIDQTNNGKVVVKKVFSSPGAASAATAIIIIVYIASYALFVDYGSKQCDDKREKNMFFTNMCKSLTPPFYFALSVANAIHVAAVVYYTYKSMPMRQRKRFNKAVEKSGQKVLQTGKGSYGQIQTGIQKYKQERVKKRDEMTKQRQRNQKQANVDKMRAHLEKTGVWKPPPSSKNKEAAATKIQTLIRQKKAQKELQALKMQKAADLNAIQKRKKNLNQMKRVAKILKQKS